MLQGSKVTCHVTSFFLSPELGYKQLGVWVYNLFFVRPKVCKAKGK